MTIANVIARLNIGGPAKLAISLTESLHNKGYRTLLIAGRVPEGEGGMEYLAVDKKILVTKLPAMSRQISWHKELSAAWQLSKIFRRERPVVVHTHTAKAGTLGRIAAIATRVPVRVHSFHGHVFKGYFSPLVTRAFLAIERVLARYTDCIIALSDSQKRELAEVYRVAPAGKISVVCPGFDLDPFLAVHDRDDALRRSINCTPRSFLVGWIGRLTAIKDPGLFLSSVRSLLEVSAEFRFVLVGDGELRNLCETQVTAQNLRDAVSLIGWRRELQRIYADLDLLVLTSINEGTPLTLLEAMAAGKAFVSTDVGGVRDLMVGVPIARDGFEIFENGVLVQRNADVLARAVAYLAAHPETLLAMGHIGREFVKDRFSTRRMADNLESLYLSLLRSKLDLQVKNQLPDSTKPSESNYCSPAHEELS